QARDDAEAERAEGDEHPRCADPPGAEEIPPHPLLPAFCSATQCLNAVSDSTTTCVFMSVCPAPQSSLHWSVYVPRRSGVMCTVVTRRGTMSMFSRNSGTKKAWMTSSERMYSSTERLTGRKSCGLVALFASG